MQLCLVACVGAACAELRIDRMRSYHLTAGNGHKAAFFGKLAHLEQRIVNGTVAENGNGNAGRFIAAYDLHAIVHGLGYPAAVDREAEECERIMVGVVSSCMGAAPSSLLMMSATDFVPPQGLK